MYKIFEVIKRYVDSQIPQEIMLQECQVRRLNGLYATFELYPPFGQDVEESTKKATKNAIDRLTAQFAYNAECSCQLYGFLVYDSDKKAISDLCNRYCIWIAETYNTMPPFAKELANCQYEYFTTLMLKFK